MLQVRARIGTKTRDCPPGSYLIGRSPLCDITIDDPRVSNVHCVLTYEDSWVLRDLDSSNGSFLDTGERVVVFAIHGSAAVFLGGDTGASIGFELVDANAVPDQDHPRDFPVVSARIPLTDRLRIGTDSSAQWNVDEGFPVHAEMVKESSGHYQLFDLHGSGSVRVNGRAITRCQLNPGDIVEIGSSVRRFTLLGLEPPDGLPGARLDIERAAYEVDGQQLLTGVSLAFEPGSLTAIVGPSGAGKSTLLALLSGRLAPSAGTVSIGTTDSVHDYDLFSARVGLVPQADVVHLNLTVRAALTYAARLRLGGLDRSGIRERVEQTLERLELTDRAELRIDRLSGGQRKRVSIAIELLSRPDILILDEPTSGLDPALDMHVMRLLRSLADAGQTVIVVTHSVENLGLCHQVVLMAAGGRIAYTGSAEAAFRRFEASNWAGIFDELNVPRQARHLTRATGARTKHEFTTPTSKVHPLLESWVLMARYGRVILADRFFALLLVLLPVVVGVIARNASGQYGLGPGKVMSSGLSINRDAQGVLLILVFGAAFIGAAPAIQEIIKEQAIRNRELHAGVRVGSYIASKIVVLAVIVAVQMALFLACVLAGNPLPDVGLLIPNSLFEIAAITGLLALASMLISLFLSAHLSTNEQAMPTLVALTMLQVVLSGALPVNLNGIILAVAHGMPSFWATNALAASVHLTDLSRVVDAELLHRWASQPSTIMGGVVVMVFPTILLQYFTFRRLARFSRR